MSRGVFPEVGLDQQDLTCPHWRRRIDPAAELERTMDAIREAKHDGHAVLGVVVAQQLVSAVTGNRSPVDMDQPHLPGGYLCSII